MLRLRQTILVCVAWGLAACGGGGGSGPNPTTTIAKNSGDNQVGVAGQALASALAVKATDQNSNPAANVTVNWAVTAGGGSVAPTSSVTGADGIATTTRTLGPSAGAQTASASISGGNTVSFTHVAQIQGATQIAASGATTLADSVLSTVSVSVVVKDQTNTPVANVEVIFAVTSGGGGLDFLKDTTDGSGVASRSWTLGSTSGPQVATVSVVGLQGSPVTFTDNSIAGNATQMALSGGNFQAGAVSNPLPTAHTVIVKDGHNNPKSGVTVTWVVGLGGGSLSSNSPATNASGIASVTPTLGAAAGVNTDTARVASLAGSPIAFVDTGVAVTNINVQDDVFSPSSVTVLTGSFIKFTWSGAATHNVTWDSGPTTPANSGNKLSGTFLVRLTGGGTYGYHCTIHGTASTGMHATIDTN